MVNAASNPAHVPSKRCIRSLGRISGRPYILDSSGSLTAVGAMVRFSLTDDGCLKKQQLCAWLFFLILGISNCVSSTYKQSRWGYRSGAK